MLIQNTPLLEAMQQKMHWLTDRQQVLADNVANANTPDFKAQDLKPFTVQGVSKSAGAPLQMAKTSAAHMGMRSSLSAGSQIVRQKSDYGTAGSNNGVVLEEQMKKAAETAMDYQMISNLYRKQMMMLKAAASGK